MDTEIQKRLKREYLEARVRSAHPVEIVTMLYDLAIGNLNEAIKHLKEGDRLARSRAITRAEQAVHELLVAIDHSVNVEFTHTLARLYRYSLDRMVAGHAQQSESAFREALSVLSTLSEAWREIRDRTLGASADDASVIAEPQGEQPVEAPREVRNPYASYRSASEVPGNRDWSC